MSDTRVRLAGRSPYGKLGPYNNPSDMRPALHRRAERFYTGVCDIIRSKNESHMQLLRELHEEELRLTVPANNPIKVETHVTWELLCIVEQPDHPGWMQAIQDLDVVPMRWKIDYTGEHCTAEEDYLADRWYDDHDDDLPAEPAQYAREMAALREAHIEPNERVYWTICDNIKALLHRLRAVLNEQHSDFQRF